MESEKEDNSTKERIEELEEKVRNTDRNLGITQKRTKNKVRGSYQ